MARPFSSLESMTQANFGNMFNQCLGFSISLKGQKLLSVRISWCKPGSSPY